MSSVRFANVAFAYPQQSSLIDHADLHFSSGWTGVVGANGSGKSTLAKLLVQDLEPSSGQILNDAGRVEWCQQLGHEAQVQDFANAWTKSALKWMSLFELEPEDFYRWPQLSPGTQRKWQLAASFACQAPVLILDEPSNHLDADGLRLLVHAMKSYTGVGVLISHDRALLDQTVSSVVRLGPHIAQYQGNFTQAQAAWQAHEQAMLDQLEQMQSERDRLKQELGTVRSRHAAAQHGMQTRSRMTSIRDSDARSVSAKGRAAKAEAKAGRNSGVARAALALQHKALSSFDFRPQKAGRSVWIQAEACPHHELFHFSEPLKVGDVTLLEAPDLRVLRGDRLWLQGPNGCGKTTLLHAIINHLSPQMRKKTLWIPQDAQRLQATTRASLKDADPQTRQEIFNLAAMLGLDAAQLSDLVSNPSTRLSPGQWRKAAVAVGLCKTPWLVILDEPTNDLDLESIERLEHALVEYPETLLVVSHDAYFANAVGLTAITPWAESERI